MGEPQGKSVVPTGPRKPTANRADGRRQYGCGGAAAADYFAGKGDDRPPSFDSGFGAHLHTPPYHPPGRHTFAAQDAVATDAADGGDTQSDDGNQVATSGGEGARRYYNWSKVVGGKTREEILKEAMRELGIELTCGAACGGKFDMLMRKLKEKLGEDVGMLDEGRLKSKLNYMKKQQREQQQREQQQREQQQREQQQREQQQREQQQREQQQREQQQREQQQRGQRQREQQQREQQQREQQQWEQPPDAPKPKRTRIAGGPSAPAAGLRSLTDAVDQAQEQQAQVAPENDQPPGPPAQNPSARQGGGGGGDGEPAAEVLENDDWLLPITARIALTAPGARQRFTDLVQRYKGAAADAEAVAAGLRTRVGSAADAAGPTLVQLRQLADNVINDFKASLQQLPLLPVSNTPETVRALTGLTETVESDVKALGELKDQLAVDMAPDKLGRLKQFGKSLAGPVQELLDRQTAYQNAVMELRAAETQKTQAGALLKRVCDVLKAANEVAAPGGGLPDLPLLTSWSADYVLKHLPMQESAAKTIVLAANAMLLQEVVANLDKLQQRSNLGQQGGAQQPPASPEFRKEVGEYIIWATLDWAKKSCGGLP